MVVQPFQYQGSKRKLARAIMRYMPNDLHRLVEPFAGSAALSMAWASRHRNARYWLNDRNAPLAELLTRIVNDPESVAEEYGRIWEDATSDSIEKYYRVREDFNRTHNPSELLYLLARCVKGSVRYNSEGLFNQGPDKRRLGTAPSTMKRNLCATSLLLSGKTIVTSTDYGDVLSNCDRDDVVYMDPPYQGVCGERDGRYFSGIDHNRFLEHLDRLNARGIRFLVSYDGRLGDRTYGPSLPEELGLLRVELVAGRSTQATLLGRKDVTVESLYLSPSLVKSMPSNFAKEAPRLENDEFDFSLGEAV